MATVVSMKKRKRILEKQIASFNIIVLEDQEDMAEHLCEGIRKGVDNKHTKVVSTSYLDEAFDLVQKKKCDILLADITVKKNKKTPEIEANAQSLFKRIKKEELFIPSIAITVHQDLVMILKEQKLVVNVYSKHEQNSEREAIKEVIKTLDNVKTFKTNLFWVFDFFCKAANESNPIKKQEILEEARKKLVSLNTPDYIPNDYKKFIIWLKFFSIRLSSVASPSCNIAEIKKDIIKYFNVMEVAFLTSCFNYSKDAVPIIQKLDSIGYPALLRANF